MLNRSVNATFQRPFCVGCARNLEPRVARRVAEVTRRDALVLRLALRLLRITNPFFTVSPNPSIERTPSGRLRLPAVTAHVKR